MKIFSAIRRRFGLRKHEETATKFLADVIACQLGALIAEEGVNPYRMMRLIPGNKTIRAYFLGLAWYADECYRIDDFGWVLFQVGAALNHLLHSRNPNLWEMVVGSFKPDYRDVLVDSWIADRKQMDDEFKKGWEMARMDIAVYRSEGTFAFERQYEMKMDEIPVLIKLMAPKFSLFQFVKEIRE